MDGAPHPPGDLSEHLRPGGHSITYTKHMKDSQRRARKPLQPRVSTSGPSSKPPSSLSRQGTQSEKYSLKSDHSRKALILIGSILIPLASLIISYGAYSDAHRADAVAIADQQQQDAQNVSFAEEFNGKNNFLGTTTIENNSNAPVHFVVINVMVALFNHIPAKAPTLRTFAFSLYDIPACSVGTINLTRIALKELEHGLPQSRYFVMNVGPMSFTDRYGVSWRYSTIGRLEHGPSLPEPSGRTVHITVPFKTSTGCV